MQTIDYVVLFGYFAIMIAIGIWAMRRVNNQEDYFMGGRGFGKIMQTFAAFGAGTGAHEPVQVGRTVWTSGLSGVWSALMWLFVTPVYWITAVWYRRMRHLTLGDWFVERYQSRAMGVAYTFFAIVFYMFYLSTMFSAIAKFAVPLLGFETGLFGYEIRFTLIPLIAGIVIIYGVLGGLTAAYWTDLVQGIFIVVLSVLLIPYGLWLLCSEFAVDGPQNMMRGFEIMHQRISGDYFSLFAGPSSGEFPIQYIVSLSLLGMVGIVVQPHFIATGGGSAKSEDEARIGLVVGNFLKRLCTVGWAITALIAVALLSGSPEIASDPDQVWGVAAREILGPMNLGLVGLMLACLLAAMMSSADTYMIVTSALVVRNVYAAYINPNAEEKRYVLVGRLTGLLIILGAVVVSLTYSDVFGQFKMAMELPILFAAPFWVGMYWRRANRRAVWGTIFASLLLFFVLPVIIPALFPSLRQNSKFAGVTDRITKTFVRPASESDVSRYQAWLDAEQEIDEKYSGDQAEPSKYEAARKMLGAAPPKALLGEPIEISVISGGVPVYWRGGVDSIDSFGERMGAVEFTLGSEDLVDGVMVRVEKATGSVIGNGAFNLDFLIYSLVGIDLSRVSKATLETLRLPLRLLAPFLILIGLSYLTRQEDEEVLDRYYAKMNTPVDPNPELDKRKLESAYANPKSTTLRKIFPNTDLEFTRPTTMDLVGFFISCVVCVLVIGFLTLLASLGAT
jgi:SSS family solute:Na+ symporter